MRFVIDSNEFIFALGPSKEEKARKLLNLLLERTHPHIVRIPRTIFEEIKRNLSIEAFREFNKLVNSITMVDEDIVVPFETVFKYEAAGFKPADAFIAAYTEYVGADILVSENRHFLTHHSSLPFRILTAEKCLNLIKHPIK